MVYQPTGQFRSTPPHSNDPLRTTRRWRVRPIQVSAIVAALLSSGCDDSDDLNFDASGSFEDEGEGSSLTLEDPQLPEEQPESDESAIKDNPSSQDMALGEDLEFGDRGEDVARVYDYLHRFGYFPNDELYQRYPTWRPFVEETIDDPVVFDEVLEQGVIAYQIQMGLEATGVVDGPTRAMMARPRCAHPDSNPQPSETVYWAVDAAHWLHDHDITYRTVGWSWDNGNLFNHSGYLQAIRSAYDHWESHSDISFRRVTTNSADHTITAYVGSGLAAANWNSIGINQRLRNVTWDWLRAIFIHEIGHTLGLHHSNVPNSMMFPAKDIANSLPDTALHRDDVLSLESLYGEWTHVPGLAEDVAIGNDRTWVVGHNGANIYMRDGSLWRSVGAWADRIAVDNNGSPWVTQPNGMIWKRTGVTWSNPLGTGWQHIPGSASDIGAGGGEIWVTDTTDTGSGYQIWRRTGSSWTQIPGAAVKVTVDGEGRAWVVNKHGQIYRRVGVTQWNRNGTGWQQMPGHATDIGAGTDANGNDWGTVWITGTTASPGGFELFVWNEQSGGGAPARYEWRKIPGGATDVAVDGTGRPTVLSDVGQIWKRPPLR